MPLPLPATRSPLRSPPRRAAAPAAAALAATPPLVTPAGTATGTAGTGGPANATAPAPAGAPRAPAAAAVALPRSSPGVAGGDVGFVTVQARGAEEAGLSEADVAALRSGDPERVREVRACVCVYERGIEGAGGFDARVCFWPLPPSLRCAAGSLAAHRRPPLSSLTLSTPLLLNAIHPANTTPPSSHIATAIIQ